MERYVHTTVCLSITPFIGLTFHDDSDVNERDVLHTTFKARLTHPTEGPALPHIELTVSSNAYACQGIAKLYQEGPWRLWQHELWDGREQLQRRRLRQREILVRRWTLYSLSVYAGLKLRESMHAWNSIVPECFRLEAGDGARVAHDPRASRERDQAKETAEKLRGYLGLPRTLTDS